MFDVLLSDFESAAMDMMFSGANGPPTDASAKSCMIRILFHLCALYNDGSTPIGKDLVCLLEALVNSDDPSVAQLSGAERTALFAVVNQFRQGRAQYVRKIQAANAAENGA